MSVKRSNFTLVVYKAACHADPGAGWNIAGSSLYKSFHIHQLTIKDTFEHINSYILIYLSFQSLCKVVLYASNLHQ